MHRILEGAASSTDLRCLFFDRDGERCRRDSIQSHSLQRMGPLHSIARDSHVIAIGSGLRALPVEAREVFRRLGLRKASVFQGFCGEHDSSLFDGIETPRFILDESTALLFSIRSIAMETRKKQHLVQIQKNTRRILGVRLTTEKLKINQLIERGAESAVEANLKVLRGLFTQLRKGPLRNFHCLMIEFDGKLPFAATGAFEPEWNLEKQFLYGKDPLKTGWNTVSWFSGNIGGRGLACISANQKYADHRVDKFIENIRVSKEPLASIIFALSVIHIENVFLAPDWLESLASSERKKIEVMSRSGVFEGIRDPQTLDLRIESDLFKISGKAVSVRLK